MNDEYDDLTQQDLDLIVANHEQELAEEEAEMAELDANALSPDEFETMMDDYLATLNDEPAPFTDEEIERILNSREYFLERIEYVTKTHTTKEEAVLNKRKADGCNRTSDDDALFAINDLTFDKIVELHAAGMSFRFIPLVSPLSNPARHTVILDIDNGRKKDPWHPNILPDELDSMLAQFQAARWTRSTSGKPYKYHVFIWNEEPIRTADDYTRIHEKYELLLKSEFKRIRGIPESEEIPRITDPKGQSINCFFFGVSQEKSETILLTHHEYRNGIFPYDVPDEQHLEITKDRHHKEQPQPRKDRKPYSLDEWQARTVPTSTAGLIDFLQQRKLSDSTTIEVEYAFRATMPYNMHKGATKQTQCVQEGNRWNSINIFAIKMYSVWRSCNLYLASHEYETFTEDDLVSSYTEYVYKAFDATFDYSIKNACSAIHSVIRKFRDLSDRDYCEMHKRYACRKGRMLMNLLEDDRPLQTLLRGKKHCTSVTRTIIEQYGRNYKVIFPSRKVMLAIIHERNISESTFRKKVFMEGYSIEFTEKVNAGRPTGTASKSVEDSIMSKGTVVDGVFEYGGSLSRSERQFLYRKGLKIKKAKCNINCC